MQFVETRAKELKLSQILALSTQAFNYFQQQGGFRPGDITLLPDDRRMAYEHSGRQSKILYKIIN